MITWATPATKHVPGLGEKPKSLPRAKVDPARSRRILPGSCQENCTRPKRDAVYASMPQDPATKRAQGLGEKQTSLPSASMPYRRSRRILPGSCHEKCTRPRRDANFTSMHRRRSCRILYLIPPVLQEMQRKNRFCKLQPDSYLYY